MWTIEHAHANQIELCVIVADVQKAFNFLPRPVVVEILAWIGFPPHVLVGWTGAVQTFSRRFQVRGSLSQEVFSTTGYPEGDALSCVAMVAIDLVFHVWHQHFFPLCHPVTFVDDWQLICCQPDRMGFLRQTLLRFAAAMDLTQDMNKTYAWSVSSRGREALRSDGFRVEPNGRNLGAHVMFSKQHANKVQTARIESTQSLWGRLRRSHASLASKISAIRVAAWPRALHAIAATKVGDQWFKSLRAGAMKGLGLDAAGASGRLRLSCIESPDTDPQFWSIIQSLRLVRDCGHPVEVQDHIQSIVTGDSRLPGNGITTTLVDRLQKLAWHVGTDGLLYDNIGGFSLFSTSIAELKTRASRAWQKVVWC